MDNVVSINRNKILGAYIEAHDSKFNPDSAYFWTGICLSVLLPQYIFYIYGGLLPVTVCAVSMLAGLILGLVRYNRSPYRPLSCVDMEVGARVPPREDASRKRAA
jgi:hypothetical protein